MGTLKQSLRRMLDKRGGTICKQWWRRLTLDGDFMTSCKATMRSSFMVIMLEGLIGQMLINGELQRKYGAAQDILQVRPLKPGAVCALRETNNRPRTQLRV